jgi:hypothetical protein
LYAMYAMNISFTNGERGVAKISGFIAVVS